MPSSLASGLLQSRRRPALVTHALSCRPMARPSATMTRTTTTDVRLPLSKNVFNSTFVCHDDEGHLYITAYGHRCVYKVQWHHGRYAAANVLAGLPGATKRVTPMDGDGGSARFEGPFCLCLHPLDHSRLLVTDKQHLRSVDVVSGETTTLELKGRHRPTSMFTCASGRGPHVWIADAPSIGGDTEDRVLLRLDMRSLEVEVVLREPGGIAVLCQDAAGDAICCLRHLPQLWRVRPDGSKTLVVGTEEAGYHDGPAAQAHFDTDLRAAAARDGSIVVSDWDNCRLRLVSPDGTVSTLAGSGDEGTQDGPPAAAAFRRPCAVAVSPHGHIVVLDHGELWAGGGDVRLLVLRTVPTLLPPPVHLSAASALAMNAGLLRSGLLADATIRVVAAAAEGRHGQADAEAAASPGPSQRGSSGGAGPAHVDIPCHRAILAAGCPYFEALFAGPLALQHAPPSSLAGAAAGGPQTTGRKRKAAPEDVPATGDAAAEDAGGAAAAVAAPSVVVVTVDDASEDAVRAVLRYVYSRERDMGGVTAPTAQDVLHLAQQWGLDGLLEVCQAYVAEQLLGPGNAAEWLVCAHLRQYSTLRRAALRAVVEHFAAVRDDPAQAALLQAHPGLLMDVTATASGAAVQ